VKVYKAPSLDLTEFAELDAELVAEQDQMVEETIGTTLEELEDEDFVPPVVVDEKDIEEVASTEMATAALMGAELPSEQAQMGEEVRDAAKVEEAIHELHDMQDAQATRIKHYTNASITRVQTESIVFEQDGGRERQDYLCFLPGLDEERWCRLGLQWHGDETGRCFLYEVYIGEPGDPIVEKIGTGTMGVEPDAAA